jgi:dihydroneopterin aldolase
MNPKVHPLRIADAASAIRHVFIRNLELLAHIGIHGHERGKPQPVRINVDLAVEDSAALEDRLDSVVDYEAITAKIRALVAAGHINLAETLAERIAQACFADGRVKTARVRVEKLHALPGAESAGVEIERSRQIAARPIGST